MGVVAKQPAGSMHWLSPDVDRAGGRFAFTDFFLFSFPLEHGLPLSHLFIPYVLWVIFITFFFLTPAFHFNSPLASLPTSLQRQTHSAGGSWCRFDRYSPSKQPCVSAHPETHWKLNRNEACGVWNNPSELFLDVFSPRSVPTSSSISWGLSLWVSRAGRSPLFPHLLFSTVFWRMLINLSDNLVTKR